MLSDVDDLIKMMIMMISLSTLSTDVCSVDPVKSARNFGIYNDCDLSRTSNSIEMFCRTTSASTDSPFTTDGHTPDAGSRSGAFQTGLRK